jgi:predicted phosphodiesterase
MPGLGPCWCAATRSSAGIVFAILDFMTKFLALYDMHWGYERSGGHKRAMHDEKAIGVALKFAKEFRPDVVIMGGDGLDCGAISHHNARKPGAVEGLRLAQDAEEFRLEVLDKLDALKPKRRIYITGNHEDWLQQFVDEHPTLEGLVDLKHLLRLDGWEVIPQGGYVQLGKLVFMHGDTISGGEHVAKAAVLNYERSVRFGHFHTAQTYTKTSPLDSKHPKTGVAVPCLCRKGPAYGKGKPNKWVQGFQWGFITPSGAYQDYTQIVLEGSTILPTGKVLYA